MERGTCASVVDLILSVDAEGAIATHEQRLRRFAEAVISVGVGLIPGQELIITAPVEAVTFVRLITRTAYEHGASAVTQLLTDDKCISARLESGSELNLDYAPYWLADGLARAFEGGAARLAILGSDPNVFRSLDADRLGRMKASQAKAFERAMKLLAGFETNWCMTPFATPSWARTVFPDLSKSAALQALRAAVTQVTKADAADPAGFWRERGRELACRAATLNRKRLSAVVFESPLTHLVVPLVEDHLWIGGAVESTAGVGFMPNIPTEEIYTMPDWRGVRGVVSSTLPVYYNGVILDGLRFEFESGQIKSVSAKCGLPALERLFLTDKGASRLGEVALVPASSLVSRTNILFMETLLDENAGSHLAFGHSLARCVYRGSAMTGSEIQRKGGNESAIHIDWTIGSADMNVDGIYADQKAEPLMRAGRWVGSLK